MKKLLLLTTLMSLLTTKIFAADTGLNPEYLNITFYKLAVSTSEYCTNLQTIIEAPEGEQFDFLSNPVLGNGTVATGEYKCIVIEFSDVIHYAADQNSTSGNCVASQDISEEICQQAQDQIKYIDGTTANCAQGEQKIALYLSTGSTAMSGDETQSAFLPPAAGNMDRGLNLGGALVVGQGISAKFIVDALGKVEDSNGECKMSEPPRFAFEKILN